MAGKKSEGLTARQRQSQRIMREKNARRKRKVMLRRVYIISGAVVFCAVTGSGIWLWKSSTAERTISSTVDSAYGVTAEAGFAVKALYLEGRNRTTMDELNRALGMKKGDPILRLSVDEIRERLEKVESIKKAEVERSLPGTMYVRIVEREPVALWQNHNKIALVDDNGIVMGGIDISPYQHLPLIIGDNAPGHVRELLAMLEQEPKLSRHFSAAIRVSDRRWNIRLRPRPGEDIEVRLPEVNPAEAWKRLAEAQASQKLLERNVKVIDLRLEGKMFIKLAPDERQEKSDTARET